ncbi:MAG: 3-deoxy-8-phosphooctulonate synthase, partial [Planctomycetes bacterium]|nr:3-deoxy-8-phosphooctulonate synthase [Planctomycetota bacterium]
FVFKASYDKANRTSVESFRGPGLSKGLEILLEIKEKLGVPVLSDVHSVAETEVVAEVLDVLQIPAFLCRQTDLLVGAGQTGKAVCVKKGQFLAPWDMKSVVKKVQSTGNQRILLTERGSTFGYNRLVTDFRSLAIMRELGCPVVLDASHSVQQPGGLGTASGGDSQYISLLARCGVARAQLLLPVPARRPAKSLFRDARPGGSLRRHRGERVADRRGGKHRPAGRDRRAGGEAVCRGAGARSSLAEARPARFAARSSVRARPVDAPA